MPRLLLADLHTATTHGGFLPLQAAPFPILEVSQRCTAGGANDFVMALSAGCYFAGGAIEMVPRLAVGDKQTKVETAQLHTAKVANIRSPMPLFF